MAHDAYGTSAHDCVNVTVPNPTGGAVLPHCRGPCAGVCQASFRDADQISLLARPQCRLAGLGPSVNPAADGS
ncbi:MAG TPA: hypothetical protein VFQ68_35625 [Streptosporangiaceae bacterium]|nr:hypothetical protein [Streptosporangiaceae bacterium]